MAALKFFSVAISPLKGSLCNVLPSGAIFRERSSYSHKSCFFTPRIKKSSFDAKAQESIS